MQRGPWWQDWHPVGYNLAPMRVVGSAAERAEQVPAERAEELELPAPSKAAGKRPRTE